MQAFVRISKVGHPAGCRLVLHAQRLHVLRHPTLPFILDVAERGVEGAVRKDPALAGGVTTAGGKVINAAVAEALGLECSPPPWQAPA